MTQPQDSDKPNKPTVITGNFSQRIDSLYDEMVADGTVLPDTDILRDNEKSPERLSSSHKYLNIDSILDNYDIRHPKPSVSRNTARKMLKRDLEALCSKEADRAYLAGVKFGHEDCKRDGDPSNHDHFIEAVDKLKGGRK